jgi:hypothetical protein
MRWEPGQWNAELRAAIRTLTQARRQHVALRRGSMEALRVFNGLYAFRRFSAEDEVIVVMNPREPLMDVSIPCSPRAELPQRSTWCDLLSGCTIERTTSGFHFDRVPEQSAFVLVPA